MQVRESDSERGETVVIGWVGDGEMLEARGDEMCGEAGLPDWELLAAHMGIWKIPRDWDDSVN